MRDEGSLPASYWDSLASIWDRNIENPKFPFRVAYYETDLWISEMLKRCKDVLEIGCGTGGSTAVHRTEVRRLVATDLSPGMVGKARSNMVHQHARPMPRFAVATISRLPFQDGTFDAVYGRGTALSYSTDARASLREIHRVLGSGGKVAVDAMNLAPLVESLRGRKAFMMLGETPVYQEVQDRGIWRHYRAFYLKPRDPWVRYCREGKDTKTRPKNLRDHVSSSRSSRARYFRQDELKALVESVGFRDVAIHPVGHLYYAQASGKDWVSRFWREHAEDLSRLFKELDEHLRPETAVSLMVTARKRSLGDPHLS